jgi:hypothetical protein
MRKNTKLAKSKAIAPKTKGPQEIKLLLDLSDDTPIYYVNYFEVSQIPQEFGLLAARMPTKLSAQQQATAKENGILALAPMLQLVFAPALARSLIGALQIQLNLYEKNFGKITDLKQLTPNGKPQN